MQDTDTIEQEAIGACVENAKRALDLMGEHGLAPVPENYAVWYSYVGGTNQDLKRALDDRIQAGAIVQEDCTLIYEAFLSSQAHDKAMMQLGDVVTAELKNVQELLSSASRDTSSYGDTLQGVSGQLAKAQDPSLTKVVIDNLITATRTMASRSQRLEQRLAQSKDEMQKLQESVESARIEARTDQLTMLANRKAFDEAFARALARSESEGEPMCLIMGDIDHFKKFNDSWGHQTGDQVLRLVAHCMRESVRPDDTPARYGGEEFAVIVPGADLLGAVSIADRIRQSVEVKRVMKRSTGEDLGAITLSLGVALARPGEPGAALVKRADACLYVAKRAGRNRVCDERELEAPARAAG